ALQPPSRLDQAVTRGVIDRNAQMHALALGGQPLALLDLPAQIRAQPVAAADDVEADRFVEAALGLGPQVAAQQSEQWLNLGGRTLPVVRGEGVERQRGNAAAGGGAHYGIDGACTGTMTGSAWQVAGTRPASVAVHDDCDMHESTLCCKVEVQKNDLRAPRR